MTPTLGQACAMNALCYLGDGEVGDNSGWRRGATVSCTDSGCVLVPWNHDDGSVYLAVRGSNCRRDTLEDIKVFLGQPPRERIAFLERYIEQHYAGELERDALLVGGHSLGGLVAMGAASRWTLPGLVQNSPGWLVNPPPAHTLERIVELRTGRDRVGAWGHTVPLTITLHDPDAGKWDLRKLHNIDRQMDLVQRHGLTNVALDDPGLQQVATQKTALNDNGVWGWVKATWLRVDEDEACVRQMAKSTPPRRKGP